jgi:hypothetical protein
MDSYDLWVTSGPPEPPDVWCGGCGDYIFEGRDGWRSADQEHNDPQGLVCPDSENERHSPPGDSPWEEPYEPDGPEPGQG